MFFLGMFIPVSGCTVFNSRGNGLILHTASTSADKCTKITSMNYFSVVVGVIACMLQPRKRKVDLVCEKELFKTLLVESTLSDLGTGSNYRNLLHIVSVLCFEKCFQNMLKNIWRGKELQSEL